MINRAFRTPGRPARGTRVVGLAILALLAAACGTGAPSTSPSAPPSAAPTYPGWPAVDSIIGSPDFVPIVISSEAVVGHNRLLVTVADSSQALIAAPDLPVDLNFYDLANDPQTPVATAHGTFQWLLTGTRGMYVATADFSHVGPWGLELIGRPSTSAEIRSRTLVTVTATSTTPALGAPAPPSDTLTAADRAGVALISTDAEPDLSFYALSIRQAIAAGKPFVVVFASPLLCTSATCGPALEMVKAVAPAYRDRVNFIHVEPYEVHPAPGLHVGNPPLQPTLGDDGRPKLVPAVTEWGLPSEPYVFIVGADGRVAAKFEGVAYHDELVAALDALFN